LATKIAEKMGITAPAPPPGKKTAVTPPAGNSGSESNTVASGGPSCSALKGNFNAALKDLSKEKELCVAADAIMVAYDTRRADLDCLGQGDIDNVRHRLNTCEQKKLIVASWRKTTFSYKCDKKGLPGDVCNAVSKPLKTARNAAPYFSLCAALGDCAELVLDRGLGLNQFAPEQVTGSIGNGNGEGTGPVQAKPHVTDGSPGSGQDGAGYSGTVAGTSGSQNYTNTSVGLVQVAASGGTPPAMTNGAVDLKGQLIQGKSGTPTFTAMNKAGLSAVILKSADEQAGSLGGAGILGD
jgi:hypothetical protein